MPKYHLDKCFGKEPLQFNDFYLVQIGRLYFAPSDFMHLHAHKDFYELTILTDGEGEVITNGKATAVKRGDIYFSLPCDMHEIRSSKDAPMKYDFFSFRTENPKYLQMLDEAARCLSTEDRVFSDERISALVCDAILEFTKEAPLSEELLYSIFTQIIVYIIRDFNTASPRAKRRNASSSDAICYQIMNYIDTHVYTMKNLEELAEVMKYNYSYLSTLFKNTTGNTLLSYYYAKRLAVARMLILENSLKISEIAEQLGYSSLYAFSRAFKGMYGVSPKQYFRENS